MVLEQTPVTGPTMEFCLLCSAAGVPNSKWKTAWTAVMGADGSGFVGDIFALDTAIRTWWKGQGGIILGTALILGGLLNG